MLFSRVIPLPGLFWSCWTQTQSEQWKTPTAFSCPHTGAPSKKDVPDSSKNIYYLPNVIQQEYFEAWKEKQCFAEELASLIVSAARGTRKSHYSFIVGGLALFLFYLLLNATLIKLTELKPLLILMAAIISGTDVQDADCSVQEGAIDHWCSGRAWLCMPKAVPLFSFCCPWNLNKPPPCKTFWTSTTQGSYVNHIIQSRDKFFRSLLPSSSTH